VSEGERDLIIRRILVALDASPHSLSALEAAVELASRFRAELLGLFVEDVNLLRLGELSFTREVGLSSATRRRLDTQQVERELRAQAGRARRALTTAAERASVRCSFRVVRGTTAAELLTAASDTDLVILGKSGWPVTPRRRLGSTARAFLSGTPCLALILERGARLRLPILVIYDGSPLAQKALGTAAALVQAEDTYLTVFIMAEELQEGQRLQTEAAEWLHERGLRARFRLTTEWSAPRLAHVLRTERIGTLVFPAESSLLQDEALLELLEEIESPVLLIR
jgi:nucleotide-binding universal stress UspA family protein